MPARIVTASSARPSACHDPSIDRRSSASGPMTAIVPSVFDTGKSLRSFFNSTIDFRAISRAAARWSGASVSVRWRVVSL
jgi:hypothetical protein